MEFWQGVLFNLIPFGVSIALYLLGVYCPLLHRNEKALGAYMVGLVLFSITLNLIWLKV